MAPGGTLIETVHVHAHQDVAYAVPGLVIVAAKRHVRCLDELAPDEVSDLTRVLLAVRRAQREALGIEHVYYFYNEDTTHHFHLWLVPRYDWMAQFGRSVESVRPALLHARQAHGNPAESEAVLNAVERLRAVLCQSVSGRGHR